MKAARIKDLVVFTCPGCGLMHSIAPEGTPGDGPRWKWNGSLDSPTFTPSIRARWEHGPEREKRVCHSFVTDGQIKFCRDSTHELAGQTVDIPDWE